MIFNKVEKTKNNPSGAKYAAYMTIAGKDHYVCDMADGNTAEDIALIKPSRRLA
jgi:hypothetical protein